MGLRERKKRETRETIHETALDLFLERGFDQVSVVEIAERAGVSKMTVFNYFPTKEDLVLGTMEEELGDISEVVTGRRPGESLVAAVRRAFLERLAARAAETGLNDGPRFLGILDMFRRTPSLAARMLMYHVRAEAELARAIGSADPRAPFAASMIYGLWRTLQTQNTTRVFLGQSADEAYPVAVEAAERAFDLLEQGLGDYLA
ncbi:TetR/AcrR family transcriptional regulator [Nonomuraea sp. NBC_01738]|uniref:TetR/AcrR family transcriptional regulator n=1 Tax=Nonomuraea sp. NBC_01738 TaxID=2976003 RepID=UPI002E1216F6|nr:TetR/AcrR family transcriptional regulator [Nonomuraea sp. NBC_01738]